MSTLSIKKLEKFLSNNGFLTRSFFTIGGMCCYIDVISSITSETFLIYIPSRYDIEINEGNSVYKIEQIEISEQLDEEHNVDNQKLYNEIEMEVGENNINLENKLENNYNFGVNLEDSSYIIMKNLKDLSRQIKRLKLCLKNVKYKTAIIYKTFLCVLKRDDSIECYNIKKYIKTNSRKLYLIADLEFLYQNIENIQDDLPIIYKSLYKVLDKNQEIHDIKIYNILKEYDKITNSSNTIFDIKNDFLQHFNNFKLLFINISKHETQATNELYNINIKYQGLTNLHNDIQKTHHIGKLEKDIQNIKKIKQDIIINIIKIREKRENILLLVDKIMFDNIVMLDQIKKNCDLLKEII